jgi:hypothetical protein
LCVVATPSLPDDEEEDWDEEDLMPLLPAGSSMRDYATWDDALATEEPLSDTWEKDIVCNNKTDSGSESEEEEEEEVGESVVSIATAWSHCEDLMGFGLKSGNEQLVEVMAKAKDLLTQESRKKHMNQTKLEQFFMPKCQSDKL